ncbi:MAG: hypothetical protein Kow0027_17600 [Saprospiraceae bacterium]
MFHNYFPPKFRVKIGHYIYTLLFLLLAGSVFAQDKPLPTPPTDGDKFSIAPTFIKPNSAVPVFDRQGLLSQFLPISADVEMQPLRSEVDQLGMEHARYQQLYKGLKVEGAVYTTHARGGLLQSMNGYFVSIDEFDVTPAVSEEKALAAAIAHSKGRKFAWEDPGLAPGEDYSYPKGELVVMAMRQFGSSPRLAWKYDIYAVEPLYRAYVFIDAKTGEFIFENLRIHHANVPATGTSLYNGSVNFTADQTGPTNFRLRQTASGGGIETYNMNNGTNYGAATDFTSTSSNFTSDNTGVQAHWGAEQTWDYFMSDHGRNSYDGAGAVIKSYVHYSVNYVNAFWNGSVMTYGDGNGSYNPLVSLDVCGHEIAHGVTTHTANLVYSYESGALNESFSDIFGEMVERHGQGFNDWIIGDEIISGGIRNMSSPNIHNDPDTYLGNFWWTSSGDNGGVHTNSGVQNKWFYLLCVGEVGTNDFGYNYNVPAIGFTKAAAIAYRNLSVYLGPNSQFIDARNGAILAAEDLYGVGSTEAQAVEEAWKAVGVPCNGASNDNVCNALPITLGVPINADGFCATAQSGEVSPGIGTGGSTCNSQDGWCSFDPNVQNSVWFTFVAPPSGLVKVSSDDLDDTQVAIWSVGNCSDFNTFTEIAANDDSGPGFSPLILCASVNPGQTYYVQVDGFSGFAYNTNILVEESLASPGNDDVCNALPMTLGVPINANSNLCPGASAQPGEVSPGAGTGSSSCNSQDGWCSFETGVQNSLWFTFVAPPSGKVDISTSNTDDTQLALWSVGDCNNFGSFTEIAANDDDGPLFAPFINDACVVPGQTYYLQIDGFDGTSYNTDITVTAVYPVLNCPANQVEVAGASCVTLPDYTSLATASDNCGSATLSQSPAAGTTLNVTTTVTITATYPNGFSQTCNFEVTVQDNTPPTAACLNPTVVLDNPGQASISTADVFDAANSSDNCGNPYPVFVTPNTFTCSNIGTNTVTLQIIDLHGNTALCNATVTVVDNIAPTVTCKNTSVTLNSQGQASIQPIEVYDSGNDNCGNVNLQSVSPNSFDCSNVGANTVTLTVNDGNGNTGTCTATVTVNDNIDPTASCKNHTVALDNSGNASITPADVNDGSSDNCGIGNISVSPSSFGCANVGANTVTLTVTDVNGNISTCTATVTVEDNTAPTALCQNFTTDLDSDGNYTLAPASVDNGSSDACGVTLSVSPNTFDCSNIGANTVTLTATDPSGNTATCTATVTINPFLTISSMAVVHETCQGYGDGQITINVNTTSNCQVRYSIDGGATFQLANWFTDLSPNTYDIVVELDCNSSCSTTSQAVVNAGPAPTTWYKDLDGDGYTDGITHVSCSPPAGYVASAQPGDCDDNNAAVNPGAAEACNGLDDNCDGIIPIDEQDNDADGYRICDGDCDDTNPAINPGAAEICNGIDDNCNGQIDEGAPANQVHVGNVILTSQAAVNNFSQCIYKIQGNLTISGPAVNSLANLSNLQEVTGNVLIQATSLPNMNGLDGLTTIGGSLTIKLNNYGAKLTSLSGLGNLTSIGQNLNISFNFSLSDCCSIDDLLANAGVGGATIIFNNASGCNSVSDISNSCGGGSIIILPGNGIALGEEWEQPRMSLFPNPATTEVTILLEGLGDKTGTLVISDLLGRTILQQRIEPGQMLVNLDFAEHDLGTGIYQVVLRTDMEQLVQRLVIER